MFANTIKKVKNDISINLHKRYFILFSPKLCQVDNVEPDAESIKK